MGRIGHTVRMVLVHARYPGRRTGSPGDNDASVSPKDVGEGL